MAQTGLLEWGNALRFAMANDPGRQLFQDQIQTHGFLYLNDYFDEIVAGGKPSALIDLVKTPGRNKTAAKKAKASKLKNVVALSWGDIEEDKENALPAVNLQPALLKAKQRDVSREPAPPLHVVNQLVERTMMESETVYFDVQEHQEIEVTAVERDEGDLDGRDESDREHLDVPNELLAPSHSDANELSVIAEGDESIERSRISIRLSEHATGSLTRPSVDSRHHLSDNMEQPPSHNSPAPSEAHAHDHSYIGTSSSVDTFHSIPLDSPVPTQEAAIMHNISAEPQSPHIMPSDNVAEIGKEEAPSTSHPAQHTGSSDYRPNNTDTVSLESHDTVVPLNDPDAPASPKGLSSKPSISSFPSLPAPMPLRKSMRVPRDPSMGASTMHAVTPGAGLGGNRTSWLKKAREVKALETFGKKVSSVGTAGTVDPTSIPGFSHGAKRKSGDMLGFSVMASQEDEERLLKVAKNTEEDTASSKPQVPDHHDDVDDTVASTSSLPTHLADPVQQEDVLNRFKKTVEGLGARVAQSMGKSMGGNAAAHALAEARAAAEARVAERNHKEDEMTTTSFPITTPEITESSVAPAFPNSGVVSKDESTNGDRKNSHKPLRVSELFTTSERGSVTSSDSIFSLVPETTTKAPKAPSSIHSTFEPPPAPVFNKPPPVFMPPPPGEPPVQASAPSPKGHAFRSPASPPSYMPASMSLGLGPRLPSPHSPGQKGGKPLTAQSTMESLRSATVFDSQEAPSWLPSTQDTEYTYATESQPLSRGNLDDIDVDESWVDEQIPEGVPWAFGFDREDSLTWSSAPSAPTETRRLDSALDTVLEDADLAISRMKAQQESKFPGEPVPGAFVDADADYRGDAELYDEDGEGMVLEAGKSTVSLVVPAASRSESQMSMASSASSQPQGFLGHATKLASSLFNTSKNKKPEVKSLQLAAAAVKREQEEKDKKATVLKNMEQRRQLALQRKAEEEKSRVQEEQRKIKEDTDRRKREREEYTDKKPLKGVGKKDDDPSKKRKVAIETEKKPELKKPAMKSTFKPGGFKHLPGQSTSTLSSSTSAQPSEAKASTSQLPKPTKPTPAKMPVLDDDISQPSHLLQSQMAARAKAQLQAAKQIEVPIPSEEIDLPDIRSEYSDSDDEDRPRTYTPPDWAQSPELRQALQDQATINPDDIFGAIRPLRMEEIFRNRTSRFRARTSSANWSGADRLTIEEERDYARRMGFR